MTERSRLTLVPVLLLAFVLAGCANTHKDRHRAAKPSYTFVFIKTGPATDLTEEQQQEAFAGHFSNMSRMAQAGQLLIAGPFADPKADENHRGLWVFDTPDTDTALEYGATDPAVDVGIFVLEAHRLSTKAPLRDLVQMNKDDQARREREPEGQTPPVRAYMLATRAWAEPFAIRAREADGVIFQARLHGSSPDGGDEIIVWLDVEGPDEADAILPEPESWTLHGWWGSQVVAELP
ncbi:MAG: YciI family protein [Planctomycetota bacterium]